MRSRRKAQNRMSVLKRTGKKNVLALALAIAMVSSTVAGEPLSIHAYADETNAISSSDDGSSKSDASSEKSTSVKEEKSSSKEEKSEAKTEKSSEEKSGTSIAAKSAIQIVTEAENSASSDTKSSDVKLGSSDLDSKETEKTNASGQKSSGSTGNTSANSSSEKSTEATGTGASQSGESSKENTTETKITTTDAAKSGTASSDTGSTSANASTGASTSTDVNGSASKGTGAFTSTGSSTGAASTGAGTAPETTAPETNAPETSEAETTVAVETTEAETTAPETTAELDEEAEKKAESARIRKGILAADKAARKAKLGKTGSWKSSIFDFVKHLFYINVVADAENEADDVEDESISEMEVSEDDIDDYSVDLGKDYTANVVDDEDHVSGKNCFTSIIMARKVSGKWKAQSEFHDGDSVRVSLAVSIPSDAMDEDSRVFYYQLPSAVTISEEQSGLMKRDDIVIGKYVLTEDGMLVVKLTDNISVNQKFRGIIVFDAELAKADDQTMEKIDFGSFVFILHDGVSNDAKGGDAEDVDDETDETEPTDTVEDDANKKATSSEIAEDGELNTRSGLLKVSNRIVTATANYPAGTFPIGTKMQVVRVKKPSELKTLKTKVDAQLESENSGKIAKDIYAYDISFIYDGEKIEPLNPVDISLQFNKSQGKPKATKAEDPEKAEWKMFHATEDGEIAEKADASEDASEEAQNDETVDSVESTESTESIEPANQNNASAEDISTTKETASEETTTEESASDASESIETTTDNNATDLVTENSVLHDITEDANVSTDNDNTVVHKVDFTSDAFSVYVLAYTVDFHYGDYTWSMQGQESILLSDLFNILGIEKDISEIETVAFSNPQLVAIEEISEPKNWKLISLLPFDTYETLTLITTDGQEIVIAVTDDQNTTFDLRPLLTEMHLYEDGKELTGNTLKLVKDKKYEITLNFRENSTKQFPNDSTWMSYTIPDGIEFPGTTEGTFVMDFGSLGKLHDNKYKVVTQDGKKVLLVQWNTNGGKDWETLKKARNAHFQVKFDISFDATKKTFEFGDDIKFDADISQPHDASVSKSGTYNKDTGTIDYTIEIKSKGSTEDIKVKDTITGSALLLNQTNIKYIKNGSPEQDIPSNWNMSTREKGFDLTIPSMNDGDVIKIKYSATLDYSKLAKSGQSTVSETGNGVVITPKEDDNSKNNESKTYDHWIDYSSLTKTSTEIKDNNSDKKTISWKIVANEQHISDLSGEIKDTISSESRTMMDYTGDGITIKVIEPNGTEKETRTLRWNSESSVDGDLSRGDHTWSYKIPESDRGHRYSYVITYDTSVDMTKVQDKSKDTTVKNNVEDQHSTSGGSATIPSTENETKVTGIKTYTKTTIDYTEWKITLNIPKEGIGHLTLKDRFPSAYFKGRIFYDSLYGTLDESVRVEGLLSKESYSIVEKQYDLGNNTLVPGVEFEFFKDQSKKHKGLNANNNGDRVITVYIKTKNSAEWIANVEDGQTWERTHQNFAWANDYEMNSSVDIADKDLKKSLKEDKKKKGSDLGYTENKYKMKEYHVYLYEIMLTGVNSDTITLDDYYDNKYLNHVDTNEHPFENIYGGTQYSPDYNKKGEINISDDNGHLIITANVPKTEDGGYYTHYYLYYRLAVKKDAVDAIKMAAAANNGDYILKNTIYWDGDSSEAEAKFHYNIIDKQYDKSDGDNKPNYTIYINSDKRELNQGKDMTLVDTFENQIIDLSSISITTDPAENHVSYQLDNNTLIFTIPDKTSVVIKYSALVTGTGTVEVSNKAVLNGTYDDWTDYHAKIDSSASGGASLVEVKLYKYGNDDVQNALAGAHFQFVDKNDKAILVKDNGESEFATNENGLISEKISIGGEGDTIQWDQIYYIKETAAPNGYLPAPKIGFVFTKNEAYAHYNDDSFVDGNGITVYVFKGQTGLFNINDEKPGIEFPATGSIGNTWIYLLGIIILLLGAEWYLLTHKEVD